MKFQKSYIIYFVFTALCGSTAASNDIELDLFQHLSAFEGYRYPLEEYQSAWQDVRNYIMEQFKSYGLAIQNQIFQTEILSFNNSMTKVNGMNIIGESLSIEENAPVFLVATHYDNTLTKTPLKENGAALAALIETARVFQDLKREEEFYQNATILFAVFDLNVKNYIPSGSGHPGSYYFVREWLSNYLKGRTFLGALILDSINTVNLENDSQRVLEGMEDTFQENVQNIKESGYKANFLVTSSRVDELNKMLVNNLMDCYQKVSSGGSFRLENFPIRDGIKLPTLIFDKIKTNPAIAFWTNSPSLPAMVLTDLGNTRIDFDEENCSQNCSVQEFWQEPRTAFVETTTKAVLQMLLHHQHILKVSDDPETSGPLSSNSLNIFSSYYIISASLCWFLYSARHFCDI